MIGADRDALLCDLAEVYHIYDFRALPVLTLAALSVGLRPDSRIKMKMAGLTYISPIILLTACADQLALLRYSMTAKKHDKPPELYTDTLLKAEDAARGGDIEGFERAKEIIFARARKSLEGK